MSSEELKEAIVEIYDKIHEEAEDLKTTGGYYQELADLNEKYYKNSAKENESARDANSKQEILSFILNTIIPDILKDYDTTIIDLKEELDN